MHLDGVYGRTVHYEINSTFFFVLRGSLSAFLVVFSPLSWGRVSLWLGINFFSWEGSQVNTIQFTLSEFIGQHFLHCFTVKGGMSVAFVKFTVVLWVSSPFFTGASFLIPVVHIECETWRSIGLFSGTVVLLFSLILRTSRIRISLGSLFGIIHICQDAHFYLRP